MVCTVKPRISTADGLLERASTTVATVHGEVVVIGTAVRTLGLLLKSTYLSCLGEGPIAVSHVLRTRDRDPIVEQRVADGLLGFTFESRCLLDHLAALRLAATGVTDVTLSVEISDAQIHQLYELVATSR